MIKCSLQSVGETSRLPGEAVIQNQPWKNSLCWNTRYPDALQAVRMHFHVWWSFQFGGYFASTANCTNKQASLKICNQNGNRISLQKANDCLVFRKNVQHCCSNNKDDDDDNDATIYKATLHVYEKSLQEHHTVHLVHAMNAERRQMASDPWTKPKDLSHWPTCRQLRNYIHHHRHHYYSARKLILIVSSHRG